MVQRGRAADQQAPKNFLTPLETKTNFANFFDAT